MFFSDTNGVGTDAESLYCELGALTKRFPEELKQSGVLRDIEILQWMIEKSLRGSASATFYLSEHGVRTLELIKEHILIMQSKAKAA